MNPFQGLIDKANSYVKALGYTKILSKDEQRRQAFKPIPQTITHWFFPFISEAIQESDRGKLKLPSQLCDGIRRDCVANGVLSTRTDGLVRLPMKYKGSNQQFIDIWQGNENRKGIFSIKIPTAELVKFEDDGILLGVAIGELVPVVGPDPYVDSQFQRLDPQFLSFDRYENCWYYQASERIKITPGDGHWVLYTPGGINEPWKKGKWMTLAEPFIGKVNAFYNSQGYASKFANPARVAYTQESSTQKQRGQMQDDLLNWGVNQAFTLPEGWDIKLIEAAGKGWEIFQSQIKLSNEEIMIALAGQIVTTLGTAGFSSGDIHQAIKADLIQSSAESLSECVNQQIIVPWVNKKFGAEAIKQSPEIYWDTTPPADLAKEAETLIKVGQAVKTLNESLAMYNKQLDIDKLEEKFNLDLSDLKVINKPIVEPIIPPTV